MASISGINSYLYNDYRSSDAINTSTERFKGTVTGYTPVEKSNSSSSSSTLTSEETKSYIAALKDFGSQLSTAATNLSRSGQSIFNQITASSTKDEALSVSVTNQNTAAGWTESGSVKKVTINQLAAAQKNYGTTLNATALSGANSGANQFTIEKDGEVHNLEVNIKNTDSVRTAQQKMADAINEQGIGITASVQYDEKTKKSALVLTSSETGAKNAFTIADSEGSGNLVSALGVNQVSQEARDAQYTVDGATQTSDKNTVELGNGITGTLKKVSTDTIEVNAKKDVSAISSAINDVVNNFNSLLKTTKDYGDDKGAQSLQQRMDSIASSYASSLGKIGISRDSDGYLKIDEDKLKTAFENGAAEKFLGSDNAGFTQRIAQLAKSVDNNPDQFVSYQSRNTLNDESAGASSNAYRSSYNSSYNSYLSAYREAQVYNLGLLFNLDA